MKFKKFVSAVSALTIAASTFVGLGITANAEDALNWKDLSEWTGNASRSVDNAEAPTVVKSVYDGSGNRNSYFAFDQTQQYSSGTVTVSYQFMIEKDSYITNRSSAQFAITSNKSTISNSNAASNSLVSLDISATAETANQTVYLTSYTVSPKTTDDTDEITFDVKKNVWNTLTAVVDLDNKTLNYAITDGTTTVSRNNIAIEEDVTTVTGIHVLASRGGGNYNVKNVTIEKAAQPAKILNVNYKSGNESIKDTDVITLLGKAIGDTQDYSFSKYIVKDNTLYVAEDSVYTKSVKLTAEETSVDVNYTVAGTGEYYFYDFNNNPNANCSGGGQVGAAGINQTPAGEITIPKDGMYSVEISGYKNDNNHSRTLLLSTTSYNRNGFGGLTSDQILFQTEGIDQMTNKAYTSKTDVALKAGKIYAKGDYSRTYIDYVLIKKNGVLPIPAAVSGITETYNGTENDGVWAKAYTFTVTPNDDTVTKVTVTPSTGTAVTKEVKLTDKGAVMFGIIAATKTEGGLDGITFVPSITVE